jgi:very-short-patch-repair endonuclease
VRVHRVPVPARQLVYHDELPITSLPWTLCDYLATLPAGRAGQLADRALQRGWFTADHLARRVRDYPHRRGNPRLRQLLALTGDGAAAESERRVHALLRRAGIEGWIPNLPIRVDGVLVAIVDLAIPECRIAIEIDGMAYHTDAERYQRDRTRQNAVQLLGWLVLRFTWADVIHRPDHVIAEVRHAIAARAA